MKELVEEVRLLWCEECADGPLRAEHCGLAENKWDKACGTGAEDLCRERARKVIARIAEGPLPNEAGRLEIKIIRLKGPRWIDSDNANDMCAWVVEKWKQGARQFIALCPEELR